MADTLDLIALNSRHQPRVGFNPEGTLRCAYDWETWPCQTTTLLARRIAALEKVAEAARVVDTGGYFRTADPGITRARSQARRNLCSALIELEASRG